MELRLISGQIYLFPSIKGCEDNVVKGMEQKTVVKTRQMNKDSVKSDFSPISV